LCNTLNFNDGTISRGNRLKTRARWHGLWEEIDVGFVHSGEILHVSEVDIVLDDLLKGRTGKLQDLLQVLQNDPLCKSNKESAIALGDNCLCN
jgi:hypothetical protein